MRILLDAHALLWFVNEDQHLSREAREAVEDDQNSVFVSLATVWELAIKVGLGKLKLRLKLEGELDRFLIELGMASNFSIASAQTRSCRLSTFTPPMCCDNRQFPW